MTKVLVTGSHGFMGSALVRELVKRGYDVYGFDNFSAGAGSYLQGIMSDDHVFHGDVEGARFFDAMQKVKPEIVFHLAAEPYIPLSYVFPERFMRTNIDGTRNVMLACKTFGVKRIYHYSSSEVYGSAKQKPMNENHSTNPQSTYAASKLAADNLCQIMVKEQEIPIIILRPFNAYGARETQPYIIPRIISDFNRGPYTHLGNLEAKRDFTYVEDTARAVAMLAEKDVAAGEIFNVGSGQAYSVREIADKLNEIMWNGKGTIHSGMWNRMRKWDVDELVCDSTKLRNLTGWKPEVSFEDGLRKTVDWHRQAGQWIWEKKSWQ